MFLDILWSIADIVTKYYGALWASFCHIVANSFWFFFFWKVGRKWRQSDAMFCYFWVYKIFYGKRCRSYSLEPIEKCLEKMRNSMRFKAAISELQKCCIEPLKVKHKCYRIRESCASDFISFESCVAASYDERHSPPKRDKLVWLLRQWASVLADWL